MQMNHFKCFIGLPDGFDFRNGRWGLLAVASVAICGRYSATAVSPLSPHPPPPSSNEMQLPQVAYN